MSGATKKNPVLGMCEQLTHGPAGASTQPDQCIFCSLLYCLYFHESFGPGFYIFYIKILFSLLGGLINDLPK